VGYFINRSVLSNLWRPFYDAIEKVKSYKISEKSKLELSDTNIDEFSLLNQSIQTMAERVQHDYQTLKEFTGHAAHEMQTPLAIIRSKLDMLMQDERMLEHSPSHISEIEQAVHKLSRLYQSLLLLTKVENRQFVLNEYVAVHAIVEYKFNEQMELAENKNLAIQLNIEPLSITFHRQLIEILIGNLLYNAIRYNKTGGCIEINLDEKTLTITNTSSLSRLDDDRLFQRFYRHPDVVEEGNGLGLSIVKQICDMAGFGLKYDYMDNRHMFSVSFVN
jgi:signal transduction histidine kinase